MARQAAGTVRHCWHPFAQLALTSFPIVSGSHVSEGHAEHRKPPNYELGIGCWTSDPAEKLRPSDVSRFRKTAEIAPFEFGPAMETACVVRQSPSAGLARRRADLKTAARGHAWSNMEDPVKKVISLAPGLGCVVALLSAAGAVRAGTVYTFEEPSVAADRYDFDSPDPDAPNEVDLSPSGLRFAGLAGIAENGPNFGFNLSGADGNQAGFLQMAGSSITTGTFTVIAPSLDAFSFEEEGRAGYVESNPLTLTLNASVGPPVLIGTYMPTLGTFTTVVTPQELLLPGVSYSLTFAGLGDNGNDVTSFVDDVNVPLTPLPKSGYAGVGLLGLVGIIEVRRRRSVLTT